MQENVLVKNNKLANISIEYLILGCGYSINDKNIKIFSNILLMLNKLKLITCKKTFKSKDLIQIDISNLKENKNFTQLYPEEIEIIQANSKDKREFLNLLKVYMLLKIRCYKRPIELPQDVLVRRGGEKAETTFLEYETIAKDTNINKRNIKKYIDRLQDLKLIKYANLGTKYKANSKNKLISECTNLYALTYISGENGVDTELEYGLKQQEYWYSQNGFKIIKKTNNKQNKLTKQQKGGKISAIKRKIKNGTATDRDLEELKELQSQ